MTSENGRSDFPERLLEQVYFIQNSAQLVFKGQYREAVRIATAIRVICHDTSNSVSLLRYLNCREPEMISTGCSLSSKVSFGESGLTRMVVGPHGMHLEPILDHGSIRRLIPFSEWWNEKVLVVNEFYLTRKQLVLAASNKDGGAHIDAMLPENYKLLERGLWTVASGDENVQLAPQAMLTLVQIGFEVANSPGIQKLIGWGPHSATPNAGPSITQK